MQLKLHILIQTIELKKKRHCTIMHESLLLLHLNIPPFHLSSGHWNCFFGTQFY